MLLQKVGRVYAACCVKLSTIRKTYKIIISFRCLYCVYQVVLCFTLFYIVCTFLTDLRSMQGVGLVYFLYLFFYSGLEFTFTFLTHNRFNYDRLVIFLFIIVAFLLLNIWCVRSFSTFGAVNLELFIVLRKQLS